MSKTLFLHSMFLSWHTNWKLKLRYLTISPHAWHLTWSFNITYRSGERRWKETCRDERMKKPQIMCKGSPRSKIKGFSFSGKVVTEGKGWCSPEVWKENRAQGHKAYRIKVETKVSTHTEGCIDTGLCPTQEKRREANTAASPLQDKQKMW